MKFCTYCKVEKFFDPSAKRSSKASGFMGAQCWDCFTVVNRKKSGRLVPCPNTGAMIRYGTAFERRLLADPNGGTQLSYSAINKRKCREDPLKHFAHNVRSLIACAFKNQGFHKQSKTAGILGCSFEELYDHIEQQFAPGMTWEGQGTEWHLDHRLPVSAATTEEEVLRLNHFTNLAPLWKFDNQSKGSSHDPLEVREYLSLFDEGGQS